MGLEELKAPKTSHKKKANLEVAREAEEGLEDSLDMQRVWGKWIHNLGGEITISPDTDGNVVVDHYSQGKRVIAPGDFVVGNKLKYFKRKGTLATNVITWNNGSTWTRNTEDVRKKETIELKLNDADQAGKQGEKTYKKKTKACDGPGNVEPKISIAGGKAKVQKDGKAKGVESDADAAQKIQQAFHKNTKLPKTDEATLSALQALVIDKAPGAEKLPSQAKINKEAKVNDDGGAAGKVAQGKSEGSGIAACKKKKAKKEKGTKHKKVGDVTATAATATACPSGGADADVQDEQ